MVTPTIPATPWKLSQQDILNALKVSSENGLSASEAKARRKQYGPNRLREIKPTSAGLILARQFHSLIVLLLAVAAAVSFLFGDWVEGIAIAAVIVINALIGFFTELKATRSMESLQRLGQVQAKVRRDGSAQAVPAAELVPGDIVLLEGGDVATADLRLLEASNLQADESALTGESVPVTKEARTLDGDVPLAERHNMLFKGTAVTRGAAEGAVVATGMQTELGHISSLVEEAQEETTPLEKRLERNSHSGG
jgi:Ca2+-transporting ATPase